MAKDTNRREFLQQSTGAAGAMLPGASVFNTSILAASPAHTLPPAELTIAIESLIELKSDTWRSGLLLLIVEHVGAVAATGSAQDVEKTIHAIRSQLVEGNADNLRRKTRASLSELATDDE